MFLLHKSSCTRAVLASWQLLGGAFGKDYSIWLKRITHFISTSWLLLYMQAAATAVWHLAFALDLAKLLQGLMQPIQASGHSWIQLP